MQIAIAWQSPTHHVETPRHSHDRPFYVGRRGKGREVMHLRTIYARTMKEARDLYREATGDSRPLAVRPL